MRTKKKRKMRRNSLAPLGESALALALVATLILACASTLAGQKSASQKNGGPKAKKTAKGAGQVAKAKAAAPNTAAKGGAKVSKKAAKPTAAKKAAAPRAESKGARILAMIARAKGATLAEIMKATDWQAHSVRGFISTAGKKHGIKVESGKNDAGERTYRVGK